MKNRGPGGMIEDQGGGDRKGARMGRGSYRFTVCADIRCYVAASGPASRPAGHVAWGMPAHAHPRTASCHAASMTPKRPSHPHAHRLPSPHAMRSLFPSSLHFFAIFVEYFVHSLSLH